MSTDDVRQRIIDYYRSIGMDPTFAVSTADRESTLNPNAGGTGTIRGAYQMTRALRRQYGIPENATLDQQSAGFARYEADLRKDMASRMGRDPTNSELYMGHHFGPYRASKMATGAYNPNTPVQQVFSPLEMRGNPHFARAGTVGNLSRSVMGDMDRRFAKNSGAIGEVGGPPGRGEDITGQDDIIKNWEDLGKTASADGATDFSKFGVNAAPEKESAADFSKFGVQPEPVQQQPAQPENPGGLNQVQPLMPWLQSTDQPPPPPGAEEPV